MEHEHNIKCAALSITQLTEQCQQHRGNERPSDAAIYALCNSELKCLQSGKLLSFDLHSNPGGSTEHMSTEHMRMMTASDGCYSNSFSKVTSADKPTDTPTTTHAVPPNPTRGGGGLVGW